jgi:hypothetical protein
MNLVYKKVPKVRSYWLIIIGFFFIGLVGITQDAKAQKITITGTVLYNPTVGDCFKKVPCVGAIKLTKKEDWVPPKGSVNISIKGGKRVGKTDRKGNYKISVPPNDTLTFDYIGFVRKEIPIKGRHNIDVKLIPTPLPIINNLIKYIMVKVEAGKVKDIDIRELAQKAGAKRETARDFVWLMVGTRPFKKMFPNEWIPSYNYKPYKSFTKFEYEK